jgi:hypothetical protein
MPLHWQYHLKIIHGDKLKVVLQSSADTLSGCVEKDTPSLSTINYSETSINISQAPPPPPPQKKQENITHVMNKRKQKMKIIHLPHMSTDIAVMFIGVSNVATTMNNTGKSAVA